jgi:hypothetical protein
MVASILLFTFYIKRKMDEGPLELQLLRYAPKCLQDQKSDMNSASRPLDSVITMTTAYTWIQSNIFVDKIDVNCKQKPPVNRTQGQRGTSQTPALKTSQARYRQMSGRNRIQPHNMSLDVTLKGFHGQLSGLPENKMDVYCKWRSEANKMKQYIMPSRALKLKQFSQREVK